jgi:hypothetical protein
LLKRSQSSEWSICNGCDLVVVQVPTHWFTVRKCRKYIHRTRNGAKTYRKH